MAQIIQFLRNSTVSTDKAAALASLEAKLKASKNNGEPIINMYYDGEGDAKTIKTLFGIATQSGGYSIFAPSDDASGDTDAKIAAAIKALDKGDTAVADLYVSSVKEADGIIEVSRVALPVKSVASSDNTVTVSNTDGAVDVKVNVDGKTIVKNTTSGVLSVASSALTQYVGSNAINVSAADASNNKTISLTIDTADKVLSQGTSGLLASISMSYDSTNKKIYLYGKDASAADKAISTIDASDFIKDGMLNKVEYKASDDKHAAADGPYLVFTWNTDSGVTTPMWISLKGLVDVYTGTTDEIVVTDNVISLAQAIKDAITASLTEISVSKTDVDDYVKLIIPRKGDKKQEVGVGVTYGSFMTDTAEQVNGIATVEAVNDVIVANEKVASAALNKLHNDIASLNGEVLKTVEGADKSVTVSATADNKASVKVNVDATSIVLDETNGYLSVATINCGEY